MRKLITHEEVTRTKTSLWEALDKITDPVKKEQQSLKVQEEIKKLDKQFDLQQKTLQCAWDACNFINGANPLAVAQNILAMHDGCKAVSENRDTRNTYRTICTNAITAAKHIPHTSELSIV